MDFPEAMRKVMEGKKVRRNDWPKEVYCHLNQGVLTIHNETGLHSWIISEGDMDGENWVII